MMQARNNSSQMLTISQLIFSRYVWVQFQKDERWWDRWVYETLKTAASVEANNEKMRLHEKYVGKDLCCKKSSSCALFTKVLTLCDLPWPTSSPSPGENTQQISRENTRNQSGKSDSALARNLLLLLKFGRWILDFLSGLIGCFVPRKKEDWPFWERGLDGSQFVIIINGLWSLDAESH